MVPSAMYSVVLSPSLMVFFMVYTIKKMRCGSLFHAKQDMGGGCPDFVRGAIILCVPSIMAQSHPSHDDAEYDNHINV